MYFPLRGSRGPTVTFPAAAHHQPVPLRLVSFRVLRGRVGASSATYGYLPIARVTLDHLVRRLEAGVGDLSNAVLLVVSLVRRHYRSVGGQWKVNARIRYEVWYGGGALRPGR